jgi:hypothetical protein
MTTRLRPATQVENDEFLRSMRRLALIESNPEQITQLDAWLRKMQCVCDPKVLYDHVTVAMPTGQTYNGILASIGWRHEFFDQIEIDQCVVDASNCEAEVIVTLGGK